MRIEFVSSIALITPDPPHSRQSTRSGSPLSGQTSDGYLHSEQVPGTKHFGVWPLSQAAEACFGNAQWPADRTLPQVSVEFDVADVASVQAAADELLAAGHELLHPVRQEPWGQRLLSPKARSSASPTCPRCTSRSQARISGRRSTRAGAPGRWIPAGHR